MGRSSPKQRCRRSFRRRYLAVGQSSCGVFFVCSRRRSKNLAREAGQSSGVVFFVCSRRRSRTLPREAPHSSPNRESPRDVCVIASRRWRDMGRWSPRDVAVHSHRRSSRRVGRRRCQTRRSSRPRGGGRSSPKGALRRRSHLDEGRPSHKRLARAMVVLSQVLHSTFVRSTTGEKDGDSLELGHGLRIHQYISKRGFLNSSTRASRG